MMESHLKIKYGKAIDLSSEFPLTCNWLTEGCNGVWGIFAGNFLESFYTTTEKCAPYEVPLRKRCSAYKECPKVAKLENIRNLGGFYGAPTEEMIIRELRANGPVIMDFEAGEDF